MSRRRENELGGADEASCVRGRNTTYWSGVKERKYRDGKARGANLGFLGVLSRTWPSFPERRQCDGMLLMGKMPAFTRKLFPNECLTIKKLLLSMAFRMEIFESSG